MPLVPAAVWSPRPESHLPFPLQKHLPIAQRAAASGEAEDGQWGSAHQGPALQDSTSNPTLLQSSIEPILQSYRGKTCSQGLIWVF